MTDRVSDDELKAVIKAGEKAMPRPWSNPWKGEDEDRQNAFFSSIGVPAIGAAFYDKPVLACPEVNANYVELSVNAADEMARELLDLRKKAAKIIAAGNAMEIAIARDYRHDTMDTIEEVAKVMSDWKAAIRD